jgi:carbamate kinase
VVPSPRPLKIIESRVIKQLAHMGVVVIAAGGGGVPVADVDGSLRGVEAVIDKDLATSALAREAGAASIVNLTGVEMVYLNYGRDDQEGLGEVGLVEMKTYYREGHFPPGSMGPKIEAAIEFLDAGGKEVIITSPDRLGDALEGKTGTRIYS